MEILRLFSEHFIEKTEWKQKNPVAQKINVVTNNNLFVQILKTTRKTHVNRSMFS